MHPLDLFLASTSPRRRDLLQAAGLRFALCEPGPEYGNGGGDHDHGETGEPAVLAMDRARRKARGATPPDPGVPVLGVDTVVDLDGEELGKPRDREDAERLQRRLAGRIHRVHTAHVLVHFASGRSVEELATASVACRVPEPAAMQRYLDSGAWRGKAGAYGLQDVSQDWFELRSGAFDTVVGLHVAAVRRLLRAFGAAP